MILVDELNEYPEWMVKAPARKHGAKWCHLVSDMSLLELHGFASEIGLRREWFQGDHYDLTPRMRWKAIKHGAAEVKSSELVDRMVKE